MEAHLAWWSPKASGRHHWQYWGPRVLWCWWLLDLYAPKALGVRVSL